MLCALTLPLASFLLAPFNRSFTLLTVAPRLFSLPRLRAGLGGALEIVEVLWKRPEGFQLWSTTTRGAELLGS